MIDSITVAVPVLLPKIHTDHYRLFDKTYCRIKHTCLCPGWQFDLGWPCTWPCWRACAFLYLQRLTNYPSLLWNRAMDCHEESSNSHAGSGNLTTGFCYRLTFFIIKFSHLFLFLCFTISRKAPYNKKTVVFRIEDWRKCPNKWQQLFPRFIGDSFVLLFIQWYSIQCYAVIHSVIWSVSQ